MLSNPEFLAEGTAVKDLEQPDRVLIGGDNTPSGQAAVQALVDVYAAWVPRDRILTTNVWSAELSKLAANAFLAQRISSINSISAICEATEADVDEVALRDRHGLADRPQVPASRHWLWRFLFQEGHPESGLPLRVTMDCTKWPCTGIAWSPERVSDGSFCGSHGREHVQHGRRQANCRTWASRSKPTRVTRAKARPLRVVRRLVDEGAKVVVCDPEALENAKRDMADLADSVDYERDPYAAAKAAHALAVLTEWREFRQLDYAKLYTEMAKPAAIFDGRNCLDHAALYDLGFDVYPVGKMVASQMLSFGSPDGLLGP